VGLPPCKKKNIMKHFDYSSLYEEIRQKQKQELKDALQNYPNHEFHFGMDYTDDRQEFNTSYPYILGYLGDENEKYAKSFLRYNIFDITYVVIVFL